MGHSLGTQRAIMYLPPSVTSSTDTVEQHSDTVEQHTDTQRLGEQVDQGGGYQIWWSPAPSWRYIWDPIMGPPVHHPQDPSGGVVGLVVHTTWAHRGPPEGTPHPWVHHTTSGGGDGVVHNGSNMVSILGPSGGTTHVSDH